METSSKHSFYGLNFKELQDIMSENEFNKTGASLLYNWHYKHKRKGTDIVDLAIKTQDHFRENYSFKLPEIHTVQESSDDKTVKFLFNLADNRRVETVLIPFQNKYTVCLSSQVGCAMKCAFCYTGTQGLSRSLKTHEIVGQFLAVWHWLTTNRPDGGKILNLVFMGQGEPLHNFDVVKKACEILLDDHGASMGRYKITISTAGYLPGLKRWKEEMPGVNLALSLHSPIEAKRNELIPINKSYPLPEVMSAIDDIPLGKKQFYTFEYLMIKNFNDSEEDARTTAELLKDRKCLINIIPFNPFPESKYQRPDFESQMAFKSILEEYKIPTMIRGTKGDDILAACGQLNSKDLE